MARIRGSEPCTKNIVTLEKKASNFTVDHIDGITNLTFPPNEGRYRFDNMCTDPWIRKNEAIEKKRYRCVNMGTDPWIRKNGEIKKYRLILSTGAWIRKD